MVFSDGRFKFLDVHNFNLPWTATVCAQQVDITRNALKPSAGRISSVARVSIPHANQLHSPIFRATFRRGIARDRPAVTIAFGTQTVVVYSMIREPVRHCLRTIARQFFVNFLRAPVVRESLNANSPVRMLLERIDRVVQGGFGVRRQVRSSSLEMYIRKGDSSSLAERSPNLRVFAMLTFISVAIQLRDQRSRCRRNADFPFENSLIGNFSPIQLFIFTFVRPQRGTFQRQSREQTSRPRPGQNFRVRMAVGMRRDFSWAPSALAYSALYERL